MNEHIIVTQCELWRGFWYGVIFGGAVVAAFVLSWRLT
jgi:hypothetical protein